MRRQHANSTAGAPNGKSGLNPEHATSVSLVARFWPARRTGVACSNKRKLQAFVAMHVDDFDPVAIRLKGLSQ